MSNQQAIIHYLAALTVFRKWLDEGIITIREMHEVEALIAGKYGLSSGSIYRQIA